VTCDEKERIGESFGQRIKRQRGSCTARCVKASMPIRDGGKQQTQGSIDKKRKVVTGGGEGKRREGGRKTRSGTQFADEKGGERKIT